jgi:4-aminobutyrate aminotransferase-like enzyme
LQTPAESKGFHRQSARDAGVTDQAIFFNLAILRQYWEESAMTLANEPDSAARDAIVQRDLGNVLHPIVQHKQLERQQLVVAGAHGSTIVDANGTEYLDAMAGLWCVNIGYGRTELAAVAAEQMQTLAIIRTPA